MDSSPALLRLGRHVGIIDEYLDQTGRETRQTSDVSREAVLRAMGIDASTPEAAAEALAALEAADRDRPLAPARVVRESDPELAQVRLRVPAGGGVRWTLHLRTEEGEEEQMEGEGPTPADGVLTVSLNRRLGRGYHTLTATIHAAAGRHRSRQALIVVPERCPSVAEVAGRERIAGVTANLYTLRSAANWGVGDLSDLAVLLEWIAAEGGAFVGVNPLHALRNRGGDISPYSPVSRLFRNTLYLDVTAVPEFAGSARARALVASPEIAGALEAARRSDRVLYQQVWAVKRRVLEILFQAFREDGDPQRTEAFRAYAERQGEQLHLFATYEALADQLGSDAWREWPERYRDPRSPAVAEFQEESGEEMRFHAWMQFELDRQLGEAARRGAAAGLPIGVYQDLAIGTSPNGSDVWANPELFVAAASVGAPPDPLAAGGQNWGLPPLDPRMLREDGYRYWVRLVRASLRHAGALRIDHVIGLFRQFWIPEGLEGKQGVYVRFPAEDMLGILALEASRAGAVVVGEDLGTVPPEVAPTLRRWGVLSSRIFYFEREEDWFRPAAEYEPMALTTANTHDMATLAGFWSGRDIEVRREVGQIGSEEEAEEQRRAREREREGVLRRLEEEGILDRSQGDPDGPELRAAVHEFLCRTPSAMVGFNLDDLVGEAEPVNVPGVAPDRFPSWTRRLSTPLEALRDDPAVRRALRCGRLEGR